MEKHSSPLAVVFTDADNTLWDTNDVFATAQLNMLERVETVVGRKYEGGDRLSFLRAVDQELARVHPGGLRYPPSLLAKGLAFALAGEIASRAARKAWRSDEAAQISFDAKPIGERFFVDLKVTPQLRSGVLTGMKKLHDAGCVISVLSEGHREKITSLLEQYGLNKLVDKVLEAPKNSALYERAKRLQSASGQAFMIGDQLDRDIASAKEAGLITVYFPGGFKPGWLPAEDQAKPDVVVSSYDEAASWILERIARHP
jgi:putative hydrolase of the HAD superfamily